LAIKVLEFFKGMGLSEGKLSQFQRWLRMKGERGHAFMSARQTPEDLAIVERPTARE
jgi:hypothetical protein